MAHKTPNAVHETTTSGGTGDLVLAGAIEDGSGNKIALPFSSQMANGDTCEVTVYQKNPTPTGFLIEAFVGTYNAGPNSITPGALLFSSTGGKIDWAADSSVKNVVAGLPGERLNSLVALGAGTGGLERTGSDAFALFALTAYAKTLLDDANAATAVATLGLQNHQTPLARRIARLEYVSATQIQLAPAHGNEVHFEIDRVLRSKNGALTFDITTDLESPQVEAASTPYYLYVEWDSALTAHLSATAPAYSNKIGYHPTNADWLCVGAVWNGPGSDFVPFRQEGAWHLFERGVADHVYTLSTTLPLAWTSLALNLPDAAEHVRAIHAGYMEGAGVVFSSSRSGLAALPTADPHTSHTRFLWLYSDAEMVDVLSRSSFLSGGDEGIVASEHELPIEDPSSPAIQYGNIEEGTAPGTHTIDDSELRVTGFSFPFAPHY